MGSDLGKVEAKQATFFSLLLPWAVLGRRPETQLLKGFSPCCLACSPEISAASDGYMEQTRVILIPLLLEQLKLQKENIKIANPTTV